MGHPAPPSAHDRPDRPDRLDTVRRRDRRTSGLRVALACCGALYALLGGASPGVAQDDLETLAETGPPPVLESEAPLFASLEPLEIRIRTDFPSVMDERGEDQEEFPGTVVVVADDGSESEWPVQVRTRGKFRLRERTCSFPPIRLNFPVSRVEGSVFEGQDKIKLVTHCRDEDRFRNNVIREYLIYRMYNALTPLSLNVRLARVTYVDATGDMDDVEAWAFFIEMEEAAAERMGGEVLSDEELEAGVHPARILNAQALPATLFQYMIGNTDFSMYGDRGMPAHNALPIRRPAGGFVPLLYDFDFSGMVNAPYARPDPSLGIRNVRQRVFRGLCRPGVDYGPFYDRFLELRPTFEGLIRDEPLLPEDDEEYMLDYLEDFWETLEDPDRRRRRIEERCRRV